MPRDPDHSSAGVPVWAFLLALAALGGVVWAVTHVTAVVVTVR